MKKNHIEFREIRPSDYSALEQIISDTWDYERFCSQKVARKMSRLYLASCLTNQNFTCVAVNDGEPVGVIMGKDERNHRSKIRNNIRCLAAGIAILMSKEGRQVAKVFKSFETLDKELLKESGQLFDGELAFFAIRDDQRGLGIGKQLFDRVLSFMKSQSIKNFYLYTDATCNFGFYEHQGMERLNERSCNLNPFVDEEILFFLYGYMFDTNRI